MLKKIITLQVVPSTESGIDANVFNKFQSEANPNNALRFELSDDNFMSVRATVEEVDADGNVTSLHGAMMSSEGVVQVYGSDGQLTAIQPGAIRLINTNGIQTILNNSGATSNSTIDISSL